MSVGSIIKKYRSENKLSQEELAEKVGVSRQAVSKWETDEVSPSAINLMALSKCFDVPVDNFFYEGESTQLTSKKDITKNKKDKSSSVQTIVNGVVKVVGMILLLLAGVVIMEMIVFLIFFR